MNIAFEWIADVIRLVILQKILSLAKRKMYGFRIQ